MERELSCVVCCQQRFTSAMPVAFMPRNKDLRACGAIASRRSRSATFYTACAPTWRAGPRCRATASATARHVPAMHGRRVQDRAHDRCEGAGDRGLGFWSCDSSSPPPSWQPGCLDFGRCCCRSPRSRSPRPLRRRCPARCSSVGACTASTGPAPRPWRGPWCSMRLPAMQTASASGSATWTAPPWRTWRAATDWTRSAPAFSAFAPQGWRHAGSHRRGASQQRRCLPQIGRRMALGEALRDAGRAASDASCARPWPCQSRARLIAARNSHASASCRRATSSACWNSASAASDAPGAPCRQQPFALCPVDFRLAPAGLAAVCPLDRRRNQVLDREGRERIELERADQLRRIGERSRRACCSRARNAGTQLRQ